MRAGLWGALRGERRVRLSGVSPERVLSALARRDVCVRRVRRLPTGELEFSLAPDGAKLLREEAERAGILVQTVGERGFPLLWRRITQRWGLAMGLPLALCLLCAASLFLWDVQVPDVPEPRRTEILAALRDEGVRVGAFLPRVDAERVGRALVARLPELKWAAVNIRGSVARVGVREAEREEPPAGAGDLVAERDGVLEQFAVLAGTAAVKPGATVHTGDVLVFGYETAPDGSRYAVRAAAHTSARSWLSLSGLAGRYFLSVRPNGEARRAYTLFFENFAQKIGWGSGILPPGYAKIEESSEASFSLRLRCVRGVGFEALPVERGAEEAEALLLAALRERARRVGGEIRSETCELLCGEDCYTLRYSCETVGPIGAVREEEKEWNRSSA